MPMPHGEEWLNVIYEYAHLVVRIVVVLSVCVIAWWLTELK
jgi:hypothetical protein